MLRCVNNGLGIFALVAIMAVTPLVPAAMSTNPPQWVWNEKGEVHDATGQFRRLTAEEACLLYNLCPQVVIASAAVASVGSTGSDGEGPDGGGCR
jgi:hypothetical protein